MKIFFFSPPGGAGELKLQSFDSESKTTSDCSKRLFSKKITLYSYFSFYQYLIYWELQINSHVLHKLGNSKPCLIKIQESAKKNYLWKSAFSVVARLTDWGFFCSGWEAKIGSRGAIRSKNLFFWIVLLELKILNQPTKNLVCQTGRLTIRNRARKK